jgi:membrane protein YqaA with SNARE-associated domain
MATDMTTDIPTEKPSGEQRAAVSPRDTWRSLLLTLGTVAMTIALIALVPVDFIERLGNYGYLGVFVLTLLSSASIVLPSPALAAALLAGKTLNPWLVGLLGGLAAGLGETTGYVAGYGGSPLAMRSRFYPRVEQWVQRWGALTVFCLAAVPSPLIDLAGIAAGTLRMPYSVYLTACILGKTLRFIGVAWLGRLL